jgi:hypothetical protein
MLGRAATHGRCKERDLNFNLVKICEKWGIIAQGTFLYVHDRLAFTL